MTNVSISFRACALCTAISLLAGCAFATRDGGSGVAAMLRESGGRFVLDRPFRDFYDTVFLFTDAGKAAPRVVSNEDLAALLSTYDVVVFGEAHDHSGIHLQQLLLLESLYARNPHWILSLEQFERDVQDVVDGYLASRIGENALIESGRAWRNYAESYRPIMVFAKEHQLPAIAAEAPEWTINCIAQWGPGILGQFTPVERSWVAAQINATPGAYRDKFMAFMSGSAAHGDAPARAPDAELKAQNGFTAQAARDDTMAESIDRALTARPNYRLLHLTGSFHADGFLGTVERLRLRNPSLKIAVISPVEVENPHTPSVAQDDIGEGTVLELVYPTPEPFVDGEDTSAWAAKMSHIRAANRCKYSPPRQ